MENRVSDAAEASIRRHSRDAGTLQIELYVGNLACSATHLDVEAAVSGYGEIDGVRLFTDRETDRARGFAFLPLEMIGKSVEEWHPIVDMANDDTGGGRGGRRCDRDRPSISVNDSRPEHLKEICEQTCI